MWVGAYNPAAANPVPTAWTRLAAPVIVPWPSPKAWSPCPNYRYYLPTWSVSPHTEVSKHPPPFIDTGWALCGCRGVKASRKPCGERKRERMYEK